MSRHKAEDLLETSPFEDDLQAELAARPARQGASKVTLALGAGVVLVAGLLLGIQAHKSFGTTSASSLPAGLGSAGGLRAAGGLGGGDVTLGTVKLVDGDKVYVQTTGGGVVTVKTTGDTKVQVTRAGKLKDLKPGDFVMASGPTNAEGVVDATSVSEGSPMGRRPGS